MMKKSFCKSLIAGVAFSFVAASANAAIIDVTDKDFGAFQDTTTGLIWMDFGIAVSDTSSVTGTNAELRVVALDNIAGELLEGGEYYGWRFASAAEVRSATDSLYVALGAYASDSDASNGYENSLNGIIGDDTNLFRGYYDNGVGGVNNIQLIDFTTDRTDTINVARRNWYNDSVSAFLVHDFDVVDVPAPTTFAIFSMALAGLFLRRKNIKK